MPSSAVFYKMFNMEEPTKAWKQKKIPLEEFERITGPLYASVSHAFPMFYEILMSTRFDMGR